MTWMVADPQSSAAARLRGTRERAGLTLDAAAAPGPLRSYVAALDPGLGRPLPGGLDRLSWAYGALRSSDVELLVQIVGDDDVAHRAAEPQGRHSGVMCCVDARN